MTDWYIGFGAGGTNSADTPANAASSFLDFSVHTITPALAGDKIWVRKTHVECLSIVSSVSTYIVRNPAVVTAQRNSLVHLVGWPSSGDPWYSERPAAGISAGWDSDVASHEVYSSYGWNYPLIVNSKSSATLGFRLDKGAGVYNFALQNKGSTLQPPCDFDFDEDALYNNIFMGMGRISAGLLSTSSIRKMTIAASDATATQQIFQSHLQCRHLIISSHTVMGEAIFGANVFIELLETYSNSVPYLAARAGNAFTPYNRQNRIRRIVGVKPYSSSIEQAVAFSNDTDLPLLVIDDFYGEGPIRHHGQGGITYFLATSANALYNSERVMVHDVTSVNLSYAQQQPSFYTQDPILVKRFSVSNGSSYILNVPFYATDSADDLQHAIDVCIPCKGGGNFQFQGSTHINVGSPGLWSGAYVTGGSAWMGRVGFLAQETADIDILVYPKIPTSVNSMAWVLGKRLFGVPELV